MHRHKQGGFVHNVRTKELTEVAPGFRELIEFEYLGLTVRQYYKAAALHGICQRLSPVAIEELAVRALNADLMARACAALADAMLAEDAEFEKKNA